MNDISKFHSSENLQTKILKFMTLWHDLNEVIDSNASIMKSTFDDVVSPNLIEFNNYDQFIEIVELAKTTVPISNMQFW